MTHPPRPPRADPRSTPARTRAARPTRRPPRARPRPSPPRGPRKRRKGRCPARTRPAPPDRPACTRPCRCGIPDRARACRAGPRAGTSRTCRCIRRATAPRSGPPHAEARVRPCPLLPFRPAPRAHGPRRAATTCGLLREDGRRCSDLAILTRILCEFGAEPTLIQRGSNAFSTRFPRHITPGKQHRLPVDEAESPMLFFTSWISI